MRFLLIGGIVAGYFLINYVGEQTKKLKKTCLDLKNIKFKGFEGSSLLLRLVYDIKNYTDFDLIVEEQNFTLTVGGNDVGRIKRADRIYLNPTEKTEVAYDYSFKLEGVVNKTLKILENMGANDKTEVRLKGNILLKTDYGIEKRVKIDIKTTMQEILSDKQKCK